MNTTKKPDNNQAKAYPLRLPIELREQLAAEAMRNQRSLNGEIVYQLRNYRQGAQA